MNEQINHLRYQVKSESEAVTNVIELGGDVKLPAGYDFLRADFTHAGPDLTIQTPDGTSFVVPGYFSLADQVPLIVDGGSVLTGHLVAQLAGPQAFGYAQSTDTLNAVDAGQSIGTIMELDGGVKATRVNGQQVTLSQGDAVFQGDIIETGTGGSVGIVFADDTIFSLGGEGRMVMDEMVYDPDTQSGSFSTTVVQGAFSFVSGQVAKTSPDGMVVNTPSATIGIRGSTVLGQAAAEGSENKITLVPDVDGNIGEIIVSNAAGTLVLNQAGATTTVFGTQSSPTPVAIWNNADIQKNYGESLTSLVKTVARKAEADASSNAQHAEQATQKADAAKEDASAAQEDASTAENEAQATSAKAQAAQEAADLAKAEAEAAQAEAEAAKIQAEQVASAEAKAKAVAAEAKALKAEAVAQAEAEAAAQAEVQAQQAQADALQAQADARAKLEAAQQAGIQAQDAILQADTSAQFNSMAKAALTAQTQSTNYILLPVAAPKADTASTAQTATTTAPVDAATKNTAATTDAAAPVDAAAAPVDTAVVPADATVATTPTTDTTTTTFISGTNAVIEAATSTVTTTPVTSVVVDTTSTIYTVAAATTTTTTTTTNTQAVSTVAATTYLTVSGKSIDGYVSGATVFIDANSNGTLDTGEVSTTTDASGNFSLQTTALGALVMTGGTDISTGQAFVGTMRAVSGSTVVTPLTTMIASLMDNDATLTAATAQAKLADVLGLDTTIDLATFDPVAGSVSTTSATATASAAIMKAAVQIQNTIVQAASVLQGADGTMSDANATANIFTAMAAQLSQETAGSTFLTDAAKLSTIITSAATNNGIANDANLTNAITTVKDVISASNTQVKNLVGGGGDLLTGLAQTSIVAQGSAATSIKAAFGNSAALTALNTDFNTNLATKVTAAADSVGDTGAGAAYRSGDDTLTGTTGNDVIDGRAGNDTISGGDGNDVLLGGTGNDILNGGVGNDRLIGGSGTNTLNGGVGNDTYILVNTSDTMTENSAEGTDGVHVGATFTLAANFENLKLLGTGNFDATGNTLANTLTGNAGNNQLDGAAGADTMVGGAGDDTYIVDNANDVVTEAASEGNDIVKSSVNIVLSSNVERLELTGVSNLNGTGNALNNTLTGNAGNNTLDGGTGNDTMIGGAGNDAYVVDSASDVVTENASEGTDSVTSTLSSYTLALNVEGLTLGGIGNIDGTGNALNNTVTGNAGNNILDGGTAGTDSLVGGAGDDTYILDRGTVSVTESSAQGTDTVKSSLANHTLAANVENLILTGTANINGTGNASVNTITGNAGNNTLDGSTGNLDVASSADTLIGGAGDDIYIVDNAGDVVTESINGGTDSIQSSVTYTIAANVETLSLSGFGNINATGNSGANTLSGNSGNNILDGGTGADTMAGGTGNDTYVVDNTGDVISESANGGTDTVQSSLSHTLAANFENVLLTGVSNLFAIGNAVANTLTGNTGANVIDGAAGNDALVGDAGNDVLLGGSGNDTLTGGTGRDVIIDRVGTTDTAVFANALSTYTLTVDAGKTHVLVKDSAGVTDIVYGVESLQFSDQTIAVSGLSHTVSIGTSGIDTLTATNSGDVLSGGRGNDSLTGGTASDTLQGGVGNDTLDGGTGVDTLVGGAGNDSLTGGAGNDTLIGGKGTDTAVFAGLQSAYTITLGKVAGDATVALTAGGDADTLVGIENLQFSDGRGGVTTIALSAAALPSGNSVNIGGTASYTGNLSAPSGSVLYDWNVTTLSNNTYETGVKSSIYVDDLVTLGGTATNHGGLLSGDGSVTISGSFTNGLTGVVAVEDSANINISGGVTTNHGFLGVNTDLNVYGSATFNNHGLAMGWEDDVQIYGTSTVNNYGAIFASDDDFILHGTATLNNFGLVSVPWSNFISNPAGWAGVTQTAATVNNFGHIITLDYSTVIGSGGLKNYGVVASRDDFRFESTGTSENYGKMVVTDYDLEIINDATLMNMGKIIVTDDNLYLRNQGQLDNVGTITLGEDDLSLNNTSSALNSGTINIGKGQVLVNNESVFYNTSSGVVKGSGNLSVAVGARAYNDGTMTLTDGATTVTGYLENTGTMSLVFGNLDVVGTMNNSGTLTVGEGNATIQSAGTLNNTSTGVMKVGGTLTLAGALNNDGAITTKAYTTTGSYSGSGSLTTDAALDVYGALTTTPTGTVTAGAATTLGSLTNSGSVYIKGTLGVSADVINNGLVQTLGTVTASANFTNNAGGTFMIGNPSTSNLVVAGNVVNNGILTVPYNMDVTGTLTNTAELTARNKLIVGTSLTNDVGGFISADNFSNGHGGQTSIVNSGEFHMGGSILNVSTLTNHVGGVISAQGAGTRSGTFYTGSYSNTLSLQTSGSVSNAGDMVFTNNVEIGGTLTNLTGGNINSADDINVIGTLTNSGNIGANYIVHGINLVNNSGGILTSGDSSTFTGTVTNNAGAIISVDNSFYVHGALVNNGTMVMGNGLDVGTSSVHANMTNSGSVTLENNLIVYGDLINQAGGAISVAGTYSDYGNTSNAGTISIRGLHGINSTGIYTSTLNVGAAGSMHVQSNLTLGGTLTVDKDAGYSFVNDVAHTLFSSTAGSLLGSFSSYVNNLTAGWGLSLVQSATSFVATLKDTAVGFAGTAGVETLVGGSANETLSGSAGNDFLYGGAGTDTIDYSAANAAVSVNLTTTTAQAIGGGMGSDTLNSIESVIGSASSDTIVLGSTGGSVLGGAGGDTITGGAGVDIVRYGAKTDGAAANAVTGMDTISGFTNGTDIIRFQSSLFDDITVNNTFAFATNAAANFTTTHEAMLLTGQGLLDADLTTVGFGNVLTKINTLGVTAVTSNDGLIVVQGAANTALYSYTENGTAVNNVTADELTLLGIVSAQLIDTTSIDVASVA